MRPRYGGVNVSTDSRLGTHVEETSFVPTDKRTGEAQRSAICQTRSKICAVAPVRRLLSSTRTDDDGGKRITERGASGFLDVDDLSFSTRKPETKKMYIRSKATATSSLLPVIDCQSMNNK